MSPPRSLLATEPEGSRSRVGRLLLTIQIIASPTIDLNHIFATPAQSCVRNSACAACRA
ncbi:Uncharacterized protein ToN1_28910 [Aromatoleum petrolei]|nr:Uncharacterized protein ToN1_28910 [Aromatoleum petrolei]